MGFVFSKLFKGLLGNEQMRIIIIGLDNAGIKGQHLTCKSCFKEVLNTMN